MEIGKARQIAIPYNADIATINESDTNKHTLDLATKLNENRKIIAIALTTARTAGTGSLNIYPNEGTTGISAPSLSDFALIIIKENTNRLQYAQSAANATFHVYCFGYYVEI